MSTISKVIPKTTSPLTKFIRTTEGGLVVVFNGVILGAAVFGSLPGTQALKWAGIVNSAVIIARTGLKAVAVANNAGLDPIMPGDAPSDLADLPAADDASDPKATMSNKPESGVKPDGASEGSTVQAPSEVPSTGPAPGANVPGATSRRRS